MNMNMNTNINTTAPAPIAQPQQVEIIEANTASLTPAIPPVAPFAIIEEENNHCLISVTASLVAEHELPENFKSSLSQETASIELFASFAERYSHVTACREDKEITHLLFWNKTVHASAIKADPASKSFIDSLLDKALETKLLGSFRNWRKTNEPKPLLPQTILDFTTARAGGFTSLFNKEDKKAIVAILAKQIFPLYLKAGLNKETTIKCFENATFAVSFNCEDKTKLILESLLAKNVDNSYLTHINDARYQHEIQDINAMDLDVASMV